MRSEVLRNPAEVLPDPETEVKASPKHTRDLRRFAPQPALPSVVEIHVARGLVQLNEVRVDATLQRMFPQDA